MLTRCFCRGNKDPNRLKQIFSQPEHCFSLLDYPIIPLYLAIRCADFLATILYKRLFPPNLHCDIGISRSKGRQQFVRRNTGRKTNTKNKIILNECSTPKKGRKDNKIQTKWITTGPLQKEVPKYPKKWITTGPLQKEIPKDPKKWIATGQLQKEIPKYPKKWITTGQILKEIPKNKLPLNRSIKRFKKISQKNYHWAAAADPGTSPGMLPGVTGTAAWEVGYLRM